MAAFGELLFGGTKTVSAPEVEVPTVPVAAPTPEQTAVDTQGTARSANRLTRRQQRNLGTSSLTIDRAAGTTSALTNGSASRNALLIPR